jgi:ATP-dependent DNA helicase RecG
VTALRGVGSAVAQRLEHLGIDTPADLLFLLPQRYEDRTRVTPIGALRPGRTAVVEGEIVLADVAYRRRRSLLVRISDGTGQLTLRFFHFSRQQQAGLTAGSRLRCYGEVRPGPVGLEMVHPEYQRLRPEQTAPLDTCLTPVYPTCEGLTQFRLRDLTRQVLQQFPGGSDELLPADIREELRLPALADALRYVHRPPPDADLALLESGLHPCQRRLALEEMLAQHLCLRQVRERARLERANPLPLPARERAAFLAGLGFELTGGQQAALAEIDADLAGDCPMMRLVQGDVGCGKTVIAAAAAVTAVSHGCQVAVMAPTELLAEQHRNNFQGWLRPLGINVAWLTGSLRGRNRQRTYAAIADGTAQVIVGTHALFEENLQYQRLGLVIVDEQHRFGVHQRLRLMDKGSAGQLRPHQLIMTATPIPRTLAMTMYADLDTSVIRELPPGRQPVTTIAIAERRRSELVDRVRLACQSGARAYWVCPLIEESEHLPSQAAETTAAMLREALPTLTVELIHGRMSAAEKEKAMKAFASGHAQVLVATTVIEVGVDVPEATLMIIENAERLGLSQLHQLRGRIGRGRDASTCVLVYRNPLSTVARQRLEVLRRTSDGFEVAQKDLELRGPGEVLGTRQTGLMQLRVADLIRDADLAPLVQRLARRLLAESPAAAEALMQRWIGRANRYGEV